MGMFFRIMEGVADVDPRTVMIDETYRKMHRHRVCW